ncbi:MAG: hypothetical protein WAX04_10970 [Oscillospiraceae bacterium]
MLDNLIMAYRAQIYDLNFSKVKGFCKKNKMLAIGFAILMIVIVISVIACIKFKSSLLMLITLIGECITVLVVDRYTVKQYQQFLLSKQHHLEETVSFLKTALNGKNLFSAEQVEELTVRLTRRIESKIPFKNFLTICSNFVKAIILPVITYVAGIYSGNLGQLDFVTVASWGVSVVLLLGIARVAWSGVFAVLRTITCRDHDAAIALREDLMDIKLMYFSNSKI